MNKIVIVHLVSSTRNGKPNFKINLEDVNFW